MRGPFSSRSREHDDPTYELQYPVDRETHNPERNQRYPHQRIYDKCQQGERPAQNQEDAPE